MIKLLLISLALSPISIAYAASKTQGQGNFLLQMAPFLIVLGIFYLVRKYSNKKNEEKLSEFLQKTINEKCEERFTNIENRLSKLED